MKISELTSSFVSGFVDVYNDVNKEFEFITSAIERMNYNLKSVGVYSCSNVAHLRIYGDKGQINLEFWEAFLGHIKFSLSESSFARLTSASKGLDFTQANIDTVLSSFSEEENTREIIEEGKRHLSRNITGKVITIGNSFDGSGFYLHRTARKYIEIVEKAVYTVLAYPMTPTWFDIIKDMSIKNNTAELGIFSFKVYKNGNVKVTVNDSDVMRTIVKAFVE